MGYEELIVKKYLEILEPVHQVAVWYNFKMGFALGVGQFTTYCGMALMFYFASVFIENSYDPVTNTMSINPQDVFMALFAIMFGASHAGTAQAFGPDIGRASGAADRVFKIVDYPSEINAVEIEKNKSHKKINFETF